MVATVTFFDVKWLTADYLGVCMLQHYLKMFDRHVIIFIKIRNGEHEIDSVFFKMNIIRNSKLKFQRQLKLWKDIGFHSQR